MADELEERVGELEDQIEELKSTLNQHTSEKWKAFAIAGVWLFAAIAAFSPSAAEHFGQIMTSAVFATGAIVLMWD